MAKKVPAAAAEQSTEVAESIAPALLAQLRAQNDQIEIIKGQMQLAIGGYIAGRGLSLETHDINFNINSGTMTSKAK